MVRHYKKKSNRLNWTDGQMQLAIQKVLKNGQTIKSSAESTGVPRSTLQKKLKLLGDSSNSSTLCLRVFTDEQEKALVEYIEKMETSMMGLSGMDLRRLAYNFATKLGIPNRFNTTTKLAGKDWLQSFMRRHKFSHRKVEHTSTARATDDINANSVGEFYSLLTELMDTYHFEPDRIYNVDEIGISVVPKSTSKIIAKKGRKQIGGLTGAERGETVTAAICMSATGSFMPPMLIFPRVKENKDFLKDAPPGAWAEFDKSEWMQIDLFTKWFRRFIEFSNASLERPVLLLVDRHSLHTKNKEIIEFAMENGVVILCLPPHCTHKLQPLDISFMKSLSHYYTEEVAAYQRKAERVNMKDIFCLLGKAFIQAAKMETAVNGFKKSGIYPLNPEIFKSFDFEAGSRQVPTSTTEDSSPNTYGVILQNLMHPSSSTTSTTTSSPTNSYPSTTATLAPLTLIKTCTLDNSQQSLSPPTLPLIPNATNTSHSQAMPAPASMSTPIDSSHSSPQNFNYVFTHQYNEPTVQIPISYIEAAKPLINLLNSCLASMENSDHAADTSSNQPIKREKRNPKGEAFVITSEEYF